MSLWPLGLYRVAGNSMAPTYLEGDILLGWRWFVPRPGQVVVARLDIPVVKRIGSVSSNVVWLAGDNAPNSTDSRHYGLVSRRQLEAKIIIRINSAGK